MNRALAAALGTALSHGPGYEPQPAGGAVRPGAIRGYFVDFTAKTRAATAAAPDALEPTALAQLALGHWERALAGDGLDRFLAVAWLAAQRGVDQGADGVFWSYRVPVPKYGLRPPWTSAMAQGQMASVFVRAALATGDGRWTELAGKAIEPLVASSSPLSVPTPSGPVLEEAPSQPSSQILNGWIYALWGLHDVAVGLGDTVAERAFEAGARCLAARVELYDVGWWSRYSLYPHALPDLAKPFYHRLHVVQLEAMHGLTGAPELAATARRFRSYDEPRRRARALVQKAAFRVARSVAR